MVPRPSPFSFKGSRELRHRKRAARRKHQPWLALPIVGVAAGAAIGLVWAQGPSAGAVLSAVNMSDSSFACNVDSITDGDTFRCLENDETGRQIRIRLSGVAARETDGTCSVGHPCPAASAEAATAELRRLAAGQTLTCRNVGTTYGRIAAFCERKDGVDLSCAMVASGTALRWDRHWGGHRCP